MNKFKFSSLFFVHSGTLVNSIGFEWMLVGISILCFIYAPFLTFLRAPPTKEEKKVGGIDNMAMTPECNNGDVNATITTISENCVTKL